MGYLQQIMARLSVDDADERRGAVEDRSSIDRPEAIVELLVALRDPSTRVREAAVDMLGSLPAQRVCNQIVPLLASDDAALRSYVIEVIEMFGKDAEQHLVDATQSADDDVRKIALDALIKIAKKSGEHSEAARQAVIRCFNDANVNVAGSAIEALGYSKNKDYLPLLAKLLRSESPWLQCAAISSIARVSGAEAEKYLASIERSSLSEEAQAFLNALLPGEIAC